jgi:hypothetical protein
MWIHEDSKSLFMHNLKCGGCELKEILITYGFEYVYLELHHNYNDFIFDDDKIDVDTDPHTIKKFGKYRFFYSHQVDIKDKLDTYFLFTFVRNPYEKLYSSYNYLKRCITENNGNILNTPDKMDYYENFNIFVKNYKNVCKRSYCHSFITQYDTLLNYSNKINFSYIGRQETLDTDIIKILKYLNFNINNEHSKKLYKKYRNNVSSQLDTIIDICDEETFLFINNHFENDFKTFGYKKYESYNEFKLNFMNDKNNYMNIHNKTCDAFCKNIIKLKYYNTILYELNESYNKIMNIDDINIITIENSTLIKKITNDIKMIESIILDKDTKICNLCNYKTYNFLSHYAHSLTCKC